MMSGWYDNSAYRQELEQRMRETRMRAMAREARQMRKAREVRREKRSVRRQLGLALIAAGEALTS